MGWEGGGGGVGTLGGNASEAVTSHEDPVRLWYRYNGNYDKCEHPLDFPLF